MTFTVSSRDIFVKGTQRISRTVTTNSNCIEQYTRIFRLCGVAVD